MAPVNRPPRPRPSAPLRREDPDSDAPHAQRRPSHELPVAVEEIDAREVEEVDENAWQRPTDARRQRIEAEVDDRLGPVTYGPPARSLRSIALDLQRWGRQYWWILAVCGATGGSFALNRLWEIMGLETKASADRREERILAAMDGGANDSKAREALDGGAHDRTAREAVAGGVQAASREAREAWLAARRAAALAGFDAGVVELDAGTTVTPRQ